MTAGRGVIHSELPQDHMMENGGRMHGFQIWVNLPSKDKMMPPRYQDIPSSDIPEASSEDGTVWAKVIAGEALGVQAVIDTVIPITYIHLKMEAGASYTHACEHDHNVMIYAFGGSMDIEGRSLHDGGLGLLSEGDSVTLTAEEDGAELLILGGPELGEPIARYGPFVMNTSRNLSGHRRLQQRYLGLSTTLCPHEPLELRGLQRLKPLRRSPVQPLGFQLPTDTERFRCRR